LVTDFSGFPRYRFSGLYQHNLFMRPLLLKPPASQKPCVLYDVITHLFDRRITNSVGGHTGAVASATVERALPMCGITRAPKLRQDV
jgi:hypothetical protein